MASSEMIDENLKEYTTKDNKKFAIASVMLSVPKKILEHDALFYAILNNLDKTLNLEGSAFMAVTDNPKEQTYLIASEKFQSAIVNAQNIDTETKKHIFDAYNTKGRKKYTPVITDGIKSRKAFLAPFAQEIFRLNQ